MREIFRTPFAILFFGFIILFIYPLLVFPKGELELLINQYHTPGFDLYFKYITNLGDGTFLAMLFVAMLFYNYYFSLVTVFFIVNQSLIVSLFKRWIFSGMPRPSLFFPEGTTLNFVDGVEVLKLNSFPSGHTATAFSLFFLLSIILGKKFSWISGLFFFLAFSVGFSRVYLMQHFVVDAWFGAIFGVVSVVLAIWVIEVFFSEKRIQKLSTSSLRGLFKKG